MSPPRLIITSKQALPQDVAAHLTAQLDAWQDGGRSMVLSDGLELATIGGLRFRLMLTDGPMDGVAFNVTVPTLADLPAWLVYDGGRYIPSLGEDDGWMHTVDGDPVYRWEPA